MREYPETQQQGMLLVDDQDKLKSVRDCCFGVQIARDGRVWICVDGETVLRFSPHNKHEGETRWEKVR